MKRTELLALAERMENVSTLDGNASFDDLHQAAAILRQIAEAQPVGTVAQHSYDQYQAAFDGQGNMTPWMRKGPHAAPMLFCKLEVGTALYTLPLED